MNPWKLTRDEWNGVATAAGATPVDIEIRCSDRDEHRMRVELRKPEILGHRLPTWADVESRDYHAWGEGVLRVDTAGKSQDESFRELLESLRTVPGGHR